MNADIEEKFVRTFIVKNRRDRLLFEFSGKNRKDGLRRFCHSAKDLLISGRIIVGGSKLYSDDLSSFIEKYCVSKQCYIMSVYDNDGVICNYKEALDSVLGCGLGAVMIFDNLAIVETEQCFGNPERYVLH